MVTTFCVYNGSGSSPELNKEDRSKVIALPWFDEAIQRIKHERERNTTGDSLSQDGYGFGRIFFTCAADVRYCTPVFVKSNAGLLLIWKIKCGKKPQLSSAMTASSSVSYFRFRSICESMS